MEDHLYNELLEHCANDLEEVKRLIDYFSDRLESDIDRRDLELEVERLYDEYLMETENRNISYGEMAYIQDLDYFELENMRDDLEDGRYENESKEN